MEMELSKKTVELLAQQEKIIRDKQMPLKVKHDPAAMFLKSSE